MLTVAYSQNVADGLGSRHDVFVQFEETSFNIDEVVCVELSTKDLHLRYLADIVVAFGELLDPSPTDPELFGNESSVQVAINNTLTEPCDIVLDKIHFAPTDENGGSFVSRSNRSENLEIV